MKTQKELIEERKATMKYIKEVAKELIAISDEYDAHVDKLLMNCNGFTGNLSHLINIIAIDKIFSIEDLPALSNLGEYIYIYMTDGNVYVEFYNLLIIEYYKNK